MRIRNIELRNTVHPERPHCGWPGHRDPNDMTQPCLAKHHVKYEIRTGRVEAGVWVERLMGLCDRARGQFRDKYMPKGTPKDHSQSGVVRAPGNA